MKRDLNSILLEARKVTISDQAQIINCIEALGRRSLISLITSQKANKVKAWYEKKPTLLTALAHYYEELCDLTEDEVLSAIINISFVDFMCILDRIKKWDYEGLRDDFINRHFYDLIYIYLFDILTDAKGRGDKDVSDFFRVDEAQLYALITAKTTINYVPTKSAMIGESLAQVVCDEFMCVSKDYDIKKALAIFKLLATDRKNVVE